MSVDIVWYEARDAKTYLDKIIQNYPSESNINAFAHLHGAFMKNNMMHFYSKENNSSWFLTTNKRNMTNIN